MMFINTARDPILSMTGGGRRFCFVHRPPLYFVAIARTGETDHHLRRQLEALYDSIVFFTTRKTLDVFLSGARMELRERLRGADPLFSAVIRAANRSPALLLDATPVLPLPPAYRAKAISILKAPGVLYAILIAGHDVVAYVQPKQADLALTPRGSWNQCGKNPTQLSESDEKGRKEGEKEGAMIQFRVLVPLDLRVRTSWNSTPPTLARHADLFLLTNFVQSSNNFRVADNITQVCLPGVRPTATFLALVACLGAAKRGKGRAGAPHLSTVASALPTDREDDSDATSVVTRATEADAGAGTAASGGGSAGDGGGGAGSGRASAVHSTPAAGSTSPAFPTIHPAVAVARGGAYGSVPPREADGLIVWAEEQIGLDATVATLQVEETLREHVVLATMPDSTDIWTAVTEPTEGIEADRAHGATREIGDESDTSAVKLSEEDEEDKEGTTTESHALKGDHLPDDEARDAARAHERRRDNGTAGPATGVMDGSRGDRRTMETSGSEPVEDVDVWHRRRPYGTEESAYDDVFLLLLTNEESMEAIDRIVKLRKRMEDQLHASDCLRFIATCVQNGDAQPADYGTDGLEHFIHLFKPLRQYTCAAIPARFRKRRARKRLFRRYQELFDAVMNLTTAVRFVSQTTADGTFAALHTKRAVLLALFDAGTPTGGLPGALEHVTKMLFRNNNRLLLEGPPTF